MEISTQIKQRRTAAGLSQEELAEQLFVTRQTLSNWETGKTYPDINSLLRLSAVFHVSLDELETAVEKGKQPYQMAVLILAIAFAGAVSAIVMPLVLDLLDFF